MININVNRAQNFEMRFTISFSPKMLVIPLYCTILQNLAGNSLPAMQTASFSDLRKQTGLCVASSIHFTKPIQEFLSNSITWISI